MKQTFASVAASQPAKNENLRFDSLWFLCLKFDYRPYHDRIEGFDIIFFRFRFRFIFHSFFSEIGERICTQKSSCRKLKRIWLNTRKKNHDTFSEASRYRLERNAGRRATEIFSYFGFNRSFQLSLSCQQWNGTIAPTYSGIRHFPPSRQYGIDWKIGTSKRIQIQQIKCMRFSLGKSENG